MPAWLRRAVTIGSPLALTIVAALHPKGMELHATASHNVDLWIFVHVIQVPLFGLVALGILLLISGIRGIAAAASRVGLGLFVVFYTAMDSLAGIASGILIHRAESRPEEEANVAQQVESFSANFAAPFAGTGAPAFIVTLLGGLGWVLAVVAAAVALRRAGEPFGPVLLIGLSAIYFIHDAPTAPLAMGSLLAGSVWLEFFSRRRRVAG